MSTIQAMDHAKPTLVVSRCLGFDACRYDGEMIANGFLRRLEPHVNLELICPEVEIGLAIPRDPIRIVATSGGDRLVQPSTGLDLTDRMVEFREKYLGGLSHVDGIVLKARSPSCGVTDAKVHRGSDRRSPSIRQGPGMFASAVLEKFPRTAIEDEGRLADSRVREHFLTRIFTMADFHRMRARPALKELAAFHARHRPLLTAFHRTKAGALERIVADPDGRPVRDVVDDYGKGLADALARMPRSTSHVDMPFPRDLAEAAS